MIHEDIVLDGSKAFWRMLVPRLKAERWLLGLTALLAALATVAGIHFLVVLPFWIVLAAALLNRSAPSVLPKAAKAAKVAAVAGAASDALIASPERARYAGAGGGCR